MGALLLSPPQLAPSRVQAAAPASAPLPHSSSAVGRASKGAENTLRVNSFRNRNYVRKDNTTLARAKQPFQFEHS